MFVESIGSNKESESLHDSPNCFPGTRPPGTRPVQSAQTAPDDIASYFFPRNKVYIPLYLTPCPISSDPAVVRPQPPASRERVCPHPPGIREHTRPRSGNAPAWSARSRPLAAARLGPPPRPVQNCQITTKCGDFRYTPQPPQSPHIVVIYMRMSNV